MLLAFGGLPASGTVSAGGPEAVLSERELAGKKLFLQTVFALPPPSAACRSRSCPCSHPAGSWNQHPR